MAVTTRVLIGVVAVVAMAAAAILVVARLDAPRSAPSVQPTLPIPTRSPTTVPSPSDPCRGGADRPFAPATIEVAGDRHDVLRLPRDRRGVPGVPPLTPDGKWDFGWDGPPSPLAGATRGHVIVNAHTYPDGSALGNLFLDEIEDGDVLIARGEGQVQCYEVERRFEVPADSRDSGYENEDGPPRLAVLACSGARNGPGGWTHRTIWFAKAIDVSPSTSP